MKIPSEVKIIYSKAMRLFKHIFLGSLLLLLSGTFAWAQNPPQKNFKLNTNQTFDLPPADQIPQSLLQEMNEVYESCIADYFDSAHRDCKCYSMTYLEARLKSPETSEGNIEERIDGMCYNPENMVGYYYNVCTTNFPADRLNPKQDRHKLCTCFGQNVARNVPDLRSLTFITLQSLQTNAYAECGFFD